jgi:hypothetical protein
VTTMYTLSLSLSLSLSHLRKKLHYPVCEHPSHCDILGVRGRIGLGLGLGLGGIVYTNQCTNTLHIVAAMYTQPMDSTKCASIPRVRVRAGAFGRPIWFSVGVLNVEWKRSQPTVTSTSYEPSYLWEM